jgi:hypothetical protein
MTVRTPKRMISVPVKKLGAYMPITWAAGDRAGLMPVNAALLAGRRFPEGGVWKRPGSNLWRPPTSARAVAAGALGGTRVCGLPTGRNKTA